MSAYEGGLRMSAQLQGILHLIESAEKKWVKSEWEGEVARLVDANTEWERWVGAGDV